MRESSDEEVLKRYVSGGDEAAFSELVRRHCNLVWATAQRVLGNREAARDVTQTVFADLARRAGGLPSGAVLAGWLYRAAYFAATKQVRSEQRRTRREVESMNHRELHPIQPDQGRTAEELQPLLDEALAGLSSGDRDLVVLRFFAGQSLAQIGSTLGINEDTAQKRVSRALDRLRDGFRQRGVAVGDGLTLAAVGLAGIQAAPTGLTASVAGSALAAAGSTFLGPLSWIALMKTKLLVGIVGGVLVAAVVWQQLQLQRLRNENVSLRQVAVFDLTTAPEPALVAPRSDESNREEQAELLRLRSEVSRLRQMTPTALAQKLESAEGRSARAEAEAKAIKEEVAFRERRVQVITAAKNFGLAARIFATEHSDQLPTSWNDMTSELQNVGVDAQGVFEGHVAVESFQFFPHPRSPRIDEPHLILFREREARRIPKAALSADEFTGGALTAMPLGQGWERSYVMMDGSVQTISSPTGDFSQFEQAGTASISSAQAQP
ncbi:MAG TPA: sigma-70 family RNA polymerase sigma factor [Verrucomicrobiota bacterium]|nr:hypothetical protein [Verrucomicrobiales bacterium]HRI11908.1 sigma-70 family RNA polymerase sigma factor [Verrucomicrobiota bacterium]